MAKRPTTDNRGAADERHAIKRKVISMMRSGVRISGKTLVDWIDARSKRFRARRGGL